MSLVHVPVVGAFTYRDADETPAAGEKIHFIARTQAVVDGDTVTLPKKLVVTLNADGEIPGGFALPTVGDGVYYDVREKFPGARDDYTIQVLTTDTEIDLATVAPVVPVETMGTVLLQSDIGVTVASQADLDAVVDGSVPDGSITTAKMGGDVTTAGKALLTGANAAAQRTSLELGSAAVAAAADFATAAQGATADSAVQPGDLATVATSGAYADLSGLPTLFSGAYTDLSGKPTLGTAAATDSTAYATSAQGALADSAIQSSDLGSAAYESATAFAAAAHVGAGAGAHANAVASGAAGFMSGADKAKLDDAVVGPASATADAVALFDGATGKLLKDGETIASIRSIPQNSQSAAYTLVLSDAGKHILHPSADATPRTFTIPANASVAYPIGTAITFVNQNAAGVVTIAITSDTLRLAGAGTTGSRTLAANGVATALKITSTAWIISGTGLT